MARRPGQLTEEDKLKLQSQGVPPDCHDELDIIRARYVLDKQYRIVGVNTGQLSRDRIIRSMELLFRTNQNGGGKVYTVCCVANKLDYTMKIYMPWHCAMLHSFFD